MCAEPKDGSSTRVPLGFSGVTSSVGDHIAHFHRGRGQMFNVLGPYIAEGIRSGDRCLLHCSGGGGRR